MARGLLWIVLAAPLCVQTWGYLADSVFYGEYVHWTGDQAARLLLVTLAATPLRLVFQAAGWSRWLLLHRRDLGIATFAYSLAHLVVYVAYKGDLNRMVSEAVEAGMLTGWAAMLILLPLALTSNNVSVRKLGVRWKRLHRTVYVAAVLVFMHWILTAFDPTAGYVHLGILAGLLLLRAWLVGRRQARQ